jgi:mannose-6-phosphate isomerase
MTDDATLYPYLLTPELTQQLWGGDALVKTYHQTGSADMKFGEAWECWDENPVENGPLAGKTVAELRAQLGSSLLGDIDPTRIFPILTKIIDARDSLSVQVHPDDAYAQRVEHQPFGKTECWYVLHADEGAELVLGWRHDTSRDEYLKRVADGSLGDILRHVPVNAGDAFYLPSGTLHAIGKGIVIFETQQASDLTYRIFDWNRTGADGKPRELHVEKAADVLNYHRGTSGAIGAIDYGFENLKRTLLIADPRFTVERIIATEDPASIATQNRPVIAMALERAIFISCDGGHAMVEPYHTALIPAAAKWATFSSADDRDAPFMFVTAPPSPETVPARLLAAGIDQARIDTFMEQFR